MGAGKAPPAGNAAGKGRYVFLFLPTPPPMEPLEATPAEIDALLAEFSPGVGAVTRRLRAVVRAVLPGLHEKVYPGHRILAYGHTPKYRDVFLALRPHTRHVNVQLARAVELADPGGLLEGTGKRIRHVKVRAVEEADNPALHALMRAAADRAREG